MHSQLLTNEELSLLLSPKQSNGPEEAHAAGILPDRTKDLESRVERLEVALAQTIRRIVFLEDQLSVRQSAAALAAPESAESGPAEAPDAAGMAVMEVSRTLSRMETYKRKKKSLFRK
ncbi:MAG: hypothetical protein K0R28_6474 [Paenibacillus sp.]|nr:hypothetical protein [Paenibacillus sp.]